MMENPREIKTDLETIFNSISVPFRSRKSNLCCGIWNETLKKVELAEEPKSLGKLLLFMGTNKGKMIYLEPEEAMFLIGLSLLQVSLAGSKYPLALNEIYYLFFNNNANSLSNLHVYQYLTRIGFMLFRHQICSSQIERLETKRKREDDVDLSSSPIGRLRSDEETETKSVTILDQVKLIRKKKFSQEIFVDSMHIRTFSNI